jgi:hypothetical protein
MDNRKENVISIPSPQELQEKRRQAESQYKRDELEQLKKQLKRGLESFDSQGPIHFSMCWPFRDRKTNLHELTSALKQDFAREWNLGYDEYQIWLCEPGYELVADPYSGVAVPRKVTPPGSTKKQAAKEISPWEEGEGSEGE